MFSRLFGETEAEQLAYLERKVILSLALLVVGLVAGIFIGLGGLFVVVVFYYWGWGALRAMFGFTTLGVLFSRNVVLAVIFIFAFAVIGYLAGFVCFLLGTGRYIYLKVKQKKEGL